VAGDKKIY